MKVEKHISELLYAHDCVIVPNLGGFVANYAPAKIHPSNHTFTPPSKNIIFNKTLKNNDGLLASHIAYSENTDYSQALKYINHFVDNTNAQLKNGAKVKLDKVGTFYLDVERNIQFEPDTTNYLLDAFGLEGFQSPAIKRDNIGKRLEKEFKDRDALPAEKKKINVKKYVALALTLPLVLGIVWVPLKTDLLKNVNSSNLNPFASKVAAKYSIHEKSNAKELKTEDFESLPLFNENDTTKYITFNLTENNAIPTTVYMGKNAIEKALKADTTAIVRRNEVIHKGYKFHLVAGCFQIQDNAEKFVNTLQSQNITASIIGKNKEGLFVVSCGDYATQKEAYKELNDLRKIQPNAWLYKN